MAGRQLPRLAELLKVVRFRAPQWGRTARRLSSAATIDDLRGVARRVTPRAVFDYTEGGAGRELTVKSNRLAFDMIEFRPAQLVDVSAPSLITSILGRDSAMPLILAPTGFTRMMHHSGEVAVARAAARAGLPYALSTMGTTSPEDLAAGVPEVRRWFQLYLWKERESSAALIERAAAHGFDSLILTIDTPVGAQRLRDIRNGMTIPPQLSFETMLDGARHPKWWLNLLTTEPLKFASLSSFPGTASELATQFFDSSATITDIGRLRDVWKGSLIVKGILSAEAARQVVDAGADAVVVSNHGGRQLDQTPASLSVLPEVIDEVADEVDVYLDGGVMTGSDIAGAIALGADAVLIGRAYLYGLMAGGEAGVDRALEILRTEMTTTMQLLGAPTIADLTPARLGQVPTWRTSAAIQDRGTARDR